MSSLYKGVWVLAPIRLDILKMDDTVEGATPPTIEELREIYRDTERFEELGDALEALRKKFPRRKKG